MTMTIEKKLRDFQFWGGAAANAAKLTTDNLDDLEEMLEELCENAKPWSYTDINDFMWFSFDTVCGMLGLDYKKLTGED